MGITEEYLVTIDVQVRRTSEVEGTSRLGLYRPSADEWTPMWILKAFVSVYEGQQQKVRLSIPAGTVYTTRTSYAPLLAGLYSRLLDQITVRSSSLTYFVPDYISFCDFLPRGEKFALRSDTLSGSDFLVYENQSYSVPVFRDTTYYGFPRSEYHPETVERFALGSVRTYTAGNVQLVLAHLAVGHELSMGWITADPAKAGQTEDGEIRLSREHKPRFPFSDIRQSTYEEPLLHHGFGFDLFVVKEAE